jgi:hypothetical protein
MCVARHANIYKPGTQPLIAGMERFLNPLKVHCSVTHFNLKEDSLTKGTIKVHGTPVSLEELYKLLNIDRSCTVVTVDHPCLSLEVAENCCCHNA